MAKNKTIQVLETAITIYQGDQADYISLTDIARYKDAEYRHSHSKLVTK